MSKLKLTGFGRLVLFLLIVAPLVYFGMQYLKKSGTLEIIKEKVEDNRTGHNDDAEEESSGSILDELDNRSGTLANKEQEALIAEQQRKIEELERKNRELQQQPESSSTSKLPPVTAPQPKTSNEAPSLDDLIRKAEQRTGRTTSTDPTPPGTRESLATWNFSYSGVDGTIEFYQDSNKLMSRATYEGMNRTDIFELTQRDNKFYVRDSPSGEYYVLREDGNLDAYDRSGFQTTCRRSS